MRSSLLGIFSFFNGLYKRAKSRYSPRAGFQPKRWRLENRKSTGKDTVKSFIITLGILGLFQIFMLSGCGTSVQVRNPISIPSQTSTLAEEIRLEVDESSLKWGDGNLGEFLKKRLVNSKTFDVIHYPIYPTQHVPIKLRVVVQGDKEEDSIGLIKAFFTGLLFFIPVGIVQYEDAFILNAEMLLTQSNRRLGPINVQSVIEANHTLFSKAETYTVRVKEQGFPDLADRMILEMRKHSQWFLNGE